ncbi:MAG: sulfate adenylyltransferase subunit CysD [Cryomorphaceae bacterium]|nr:sulfate adenylyltransferase subunit CysD [Cryomorphaceae bacterium]
MTHGYTLSNLDVLEAESIFVLREVYAQFQNPVLLFSGGKDSIVITHLARKAFYPASVPFPLLQVDTGHNFPEALGFRDKLVEKHGFRLLIASVEDAIASGLVVEESGAHASRNKIQTPVLLDFIEKNNIDAAIGGARRDEEKSRAKERFFSHRDEFGQWDPKNQRPELWNLFNGKHHPGEHFRIFPISNWTELDVWHYIQREKIELPSIYFAHERQVVYRNNTWIPLSEHLVLREGEQVETKILRFRTLGDITITGGIESEADTLEKVIAEVAASRQTERGNRADDKRGENAMEDRKRTGYF